MVKNIIILHGWQSKIKRWQSFREKLAKYFKVYLPVMPGFGDKKLSQPLMLDDYISWLKDYLNKNKIYRPVIIGHSFGGRVAIRFIAEGNECDKLILIAAAGIKPPIGIKQIVGLILAKLGKLIFCLPLVSVLKNPARWLLYTFLREKDYYLADENLKETMKNILKIDLTPQLTKINIPTLIMWGRQDKATPVANGYLMKQKITNAQLKIWDEGSHALPFEKTEEIVKIIINFCRQ